jgi:ABC-type multidrug transport system fused ATPase/permease subunit
MSIREKILTILALILGICLTGFGAYVIGLVVWGYTRFHKEAGASIVVAPIAVLFLLGGVLLLLRAFRGPKKSGGDS